MLWLAGLVIEKLCWPWDKLFVETAVGVYINNRLCVLAVYMRNPNSVLVLLLLSSHIAAERGSGTHFALISL